VRGRRSGSRHAGGSPEAGLSGLRWVPGTAEALGELELGPCRLVTFGQSYHWTAGVPVLNVVHRLLEPGGAVALIGHRAQGRPEPAGPGPPRIPEEILDLVRQFVDDDADHGPGPQARRSTPHLHEGDVRASRFATCRTVYAAGRPDVVRSVDSVLAGYYSTSYAAPRRFGPRRASFEAAVRALLLARSPEGLLWDWPGDTEIVLATA
jgi:hypothetical protein